MTDEYHPLVAISQADTSGTPTKAVCERCGAEWTRPADDPHATALAHFAWDHRHEGEERA